MSTEIATTFADQVAYLILRPPAGKPPTLDYAVMEQFERALTAIEARAESLVAVVVQSDSPKFFCAGANLEVMKTMDENSIGAWIKRGHELMNRLESLPLPVVARVEGYAMGGGLELAMACDLILASSNARFAQSEAKLGLVTGWGGCFRLARRVGLARAKELCFTGRIVDAEEAVRLGVADWHGAPAELELYVCQILQQMAGCGRVALRETKRILSRCAQLTAQENAALEADASVKCLREGDAPERLRLFFESRKSPRPQADQSVRPGSTP